MRKLFKERKLFKGGNYMRKYGEMNIFYLKQIWTSVGTLISLPALLTLSSWESICYSSMLKKLSISSSSSALFCTGWTGNFVKDIPYARPHKPLLVRSHFWIQAIHKGRIFYKNLLKNKEMVFGNGVKNIQASAYNGAHTVYYFPL